MPNPLKDQRRLESPESLFGTEHDPRWTKCHCKEPNIVNCICCVPGKRMCLDCGMERIDFDK